MTLSKQLQHIAQRILKEDSVSPLDIEGTRSGKNVDVAHSYGAGIIIVTHDSREILLGKRNSRSGNNKWSLFGGSQDMEDGKMGDKNAALKNAERELYEELPQLDPNNGKYNPHFYQKKEIFNLTTRKTGKAKDANGKDINVVTGIGHFTVYGYVVEHKTDGLPIKWKPNTSEHSSVKWWDINDVIELCKKEIKKPNSTEIFGLLAQIFGIKDEALNQLNHIASQPPKNKSRPKTTGKGTPQQTEKVDKEDGHPDIILKGKPLSGNKNSGFNQLGKQLESEGFSLKTKNTNEGWVYTKGNVVAKVASDPCWLVYAEWLIRDAKKELDGKLIRYFPKIEKILKYHHSHTQTSQHTSDSENRNITYVAYMEKLRDVDWGRSGTPDEFDTSIELKNKKIGHRHFLFSHLFYVCVKGGAAHRKIGRSSGNGATLSGEEQALARVYRRMKEMYPGLNKAVRAILNNYQNKSEWKNQCYLEHYKTQGGIARGAPNVMIRGGRDNIVLIDPLRPKVHGNK